jgi:3-hydroxyisobutyrate dehydrogenase-like beta-hydroxyacid dehydrogenase
MGKASFHFGAEVGAGSRMKLVVNMVMGAQLNALAEGVQLTEAAGLPVDKLVEVLGLGAMASALVQGKGAAITKRSYDAQFSLKHAQKGMRFALALGDELGVAMPVATAANEQFKKARTEHGDEDFSAVLEVGRKPAP